MQLRYVAILSDDGSAMAAMAAAVTASMGFVRVFAADRVTILSNQPERCVDLHPGAGAILGHIFTGSPRSSVVHDMSPATTETCLATDGETLITHYWGGYVAVLVHGDGRRVSVIRDPSGELPCYHLHAGGTVVVGSDLDAMLATGIDRPPIDWAALADHLQAPNVPMARTALKSVSELLPGMRLTVAPGGSLGIDAVWSPWRFTRVPCEVRADLPERLQAVISDCVRAWGAQFASPLVSLSGGLDSSIVAASLGAEARSFTAVNLLAGGPAGDERRYAQAVAERHAVALEVATLRVEDVDICRASAALHPRPIGRCIGQAFDAAYDAIVATGPADVILMGEGGDNVFCALQSPTPAADRLLVEGWSRGFWGTLLDCRALTDSTLMTAAIWAFRKAYLAPRSYRWTWQRTLLAPDLARPIAGLGSVDGQVAPRGEVPGKLAHVAMLRRAQVRWHATGKTMTPIVSPLLAQPIMELCLSIPSWRWCETGVNRYPVRQAFASLLPSDVVHRRSKGSPDIFAAAVVRHNRNAIAERLSEGLLAHAGLLDRKAVADALSPAGLALGNHMVRVLELLEAEAWAREWSRTA